VAPLEWCDPTRRADRPEPDGARGGVGSGWVEGCGPVARKKSGIGLLGWIAVVVLILIVVAYLQHHNVIHLPTTTHH
jgi:hypothetical protein